MADVLLTGGESSRFQQNLVKGKQSLINSEANLGWPFAGPSDYKDPGMYAVFALYKPNFTPKQIVEQIEGEFEKLKSVPVDEKELSRGRTFLKADRIRELQGSLTRAKLLAQYEMFDGKPEPITT